VYNDHVNTDMSYVDFSELYRNCWQQKYGFLVIDKESALIKARIRLEIKIEIELDFDQSKQSSLNLRLVFFLLID